MIASTKQFFPFKATRQLLDEYGPVPTALDGNDEEEFTCMHDELISTSYTGGDEVVECAICGERVFHSWTG